jgi:hypothetical protein
MRIVALPLADVAADLGGLVARFRDRPTEALALDSNVCLMEQAFATLDPPRLVDLRDANDDAQRRKD